MQETNKTNFFDVLLDWFKELPTLVRWLIGIATLLIVVVILFLIIGHKSHKNLAINSDNSQPVVFEVQPNKIEFYDVTVGESVNKMITVKTNQPVVIKDITISNNDEFKMLDSCTDSVITDECMINIYYTPQSEHKKSETVIKISWHIESQEQIIKTEDVNVFYSSKPDDKKIIEEQEVFKDDQTEQEQDETETEDETEDEETYIVPDAEEEIKEIATPNPFVQPQKIVEDTAVLVPPENCSEFAIPGYDTSGRQIGWIKPERGANYFHPFSDKDCSKPTGRYDLSTGIITSLTDGSKIGTDSDHIGYRNVKNRKLTVPQLNAPSGSRNKVSTKEPIWNNSLKKYTTSLKSFTERKKETDWDTEKLKYLGSAESDESVVSSRPYDRTFILRQFKPIPATIVSEVRADPSVYGCKGVEKTCAPNDNYSIPVRATVDRNVYSDDGRTIILPTGTLLMGYLSGDLPGPYQAFGRMNIKWYQFIRPDGVEFNFGQNQDPYSADAQGRMGVPGHGSTDYIEQMVMPILTALVPAAVNMIAPITDTVINQIDLDNNSIVQSGTIRSSEMAKQDIINTWNKITQKLLVDAIDNTVPPFSIAAGTRINVFSPVDLIVTCGETENEGKKCAFTTYNDKNRRKWSDLKAEVSVNKKDKSWVGQVRSFNLNKYCKYDEKTKKVTIDDTEWTKSGYDYRTVLAYCEAQNYQAINNAKNAAYSANVQQQADKKQEQYGITYDWDKNGLKTNFEDTDKEQAYNTEVLGLTYDEDGNMVNPFAKPAYAAPEEDIGLTCDDGSTPDANGCCPGETYTDMGETYTNPSGTHYACCSPSGGCLDPFEME